MTRRITSTQVSLAAISSMVVSFVVAAAFARLAAAEIADEAEPADAQRRTHVVERGQTLIRIARSYGCDVAEIKRANGLDSDFIRAGQELAVPRCAANGSRGRAGNSSRGRSSRHAGDSGTSTSYHVQAGDTLSAIAKQYDTSVADIQRRNHLEGTLIRPGQTLRIAIGEDGVGRPIPGQSIGSPHRGKLVGGVQLPRGKGKGYFRRRPSESWGASHVVHHVQRAVRVVRRKFPKVHDLAIGDLSRKRGGAIPRHRSHQSGRDVDIGLYFTRRPRGYPRSFVTATADNMHFRATWTLLTAFADSAGDPGGVAMLFLDYDLQALLYKWARKQGVSKQRLTELFQYPRGKHAARGMIRHEPGHDDHVHVRFQCPPDDDDCR